MTSASYNLAFVRDGPVSFQRASANSKLTAVAEEHIPGSRFKRPIPTAPYCSATYVSIEATCPSTCRFKNAGCFVQSGITGSRARKLDEAAEGMTGLAVSRHEAAVIDAQWPQGVPDRRPLRLHVGGDVSGPEGARELAAAAWRWMLRGGGPVWTYTHRWGEIPREAWGNISVWASCESREDVLEAQALGYQTSMTVSRFPSERRFNLKHTDLKVIPCPAQTRDTSCVKCRLCLDRPLDDPLRTLRSGAVIAFAVHGPRRNRANLPVLQGDYIAPADDVDFAWMDVLNAKAWAQMQATRAGLVTAEDAVAEAMEAMGLEPE